MQRSYSITLESVFGCIGPELPVVITAQPTSRTDPNVTGLVLEDRVNVVLGQPFVHRIHSDYLRPDAKDPGTVHSDPDIAFTIFVYFPYQVVSKTVAGVVDRELPTTQYAYSASRSRHPEISFLVFTNTCSFDILG